MPDKMNLTIMESLIQYTRERAIQYRTFTGAFIVKDNQIVWRDITSIEIDNNPLAHAELKALQNALPLMNGTLSGCHLYTTQQPCPMCASAIAWCGIEAVYYGIPSHHHWRESKDIHDFFAKLGIQCEGPILEDACQEINALLIEHGI